MGEAKWYIVNTVVGYENKVSVLIMDEARRRGIEGAIEDIVVPTETVKRNQRGKKIDIEKKMMPGYVLIKLIPSDALWNMIRNTQYVAKFLGISNKPSEVPQREIDVVLSKIEQVKKDEEKTNIFEVGEIVKVMDGAFAGFSAIIEDINSTRNKIKVSVSIFGRETSLELSSEQVEKSKTEQPW